MSSGPVVQRPETVDQAVDALRRLGDSGAVLAGGTWIMRASLRGEAPKTGYVAVEDIAELDQIEPGSVTRIGARSTHTRLAELTHPALAVLAQAAHLSGFPAVRAVATIGGNLGAQPFPEADLLPALIAADATIEIAGAAGRRSEPIQLFLRNRSQGAEGELITAVVVPTPEGRRSGYRRFTVRGGGEYPIASAAISVDLAADGTVIDARIAVGSVEELARSCESAARLLVGAPLHRDNIDAAGKTAAEECAAREGLDAPGWYRKAVLPSLVRDALESVMEATK